MAKNKNNWIVITGGPSSGKTTVINLLKEKGYNTTIEHARNYIDTHYKMGKTIDQIRSDTKTLQNGILDLQLAQEEILEKDDLVFLDRAIPDSKAYYQFLDLSYCKKLLGALNGVHYRKVFILDFLPMEKDYARTEDSHEQKQIHDLITSVYNDLNFPIVVVPVMSPAQRVEFILAHL